MNAADEILVYRFLDRDIQFPGISDGLHAVLKAWRMTKKDEKGDALPALSRLLDVDAWARGVARALDLRRA